MFRLYAYNPTANRWDFVGPESSDYTVLNEIVHRVEESSNIVVAIKNPAGEWE